MLLRRIGSMSRLFLTSLPIDTYKSPGLKIYVFRYCNTSFLPSNASRKVINPVAKFDFFAANVISFRIRVYKGESATIPAGSGASTGESAAVANAGQEEAPFRGLLNYLGREAQNQSRRKRIYKPGRAELCSGPGRLPLLQLVHVFVWACARALHL